jgi:hypothetical protein
MQKLSIILAIIIFATVSAYAGTIHVTYPNGGETLCRGKPCTITWTSSGITIPLRIVLVKNGNRVGDIITNLPANTTSYTWPNPGSYIGGKVPAGNDYTIRVRVDTSTSTTESDDSDAFFSIMDACLVSRAPTDRPQPLKFPRLAITGVDLVPNAEGFGIIFAYKNVGTGALPKRSEMAVKPDFRVLIDGKEIEKGDLFIPETPAPPGWEIKTHFGGWIKYPANMDYQWNIGNTIMVYINEKKAGGMNSDSKSWPLKPIALKYSFDVLINGIAFDWKTNQVTVYYRINGKAPQPDKTFTLFCKSLTVDTGFFYTDRHIKPGFYTVKGAVNLQKNTKYVEFEVSAYGPALKEDIDQRNNKYNQTFRR